MIFDENDIEFDLDGPTPLEQLIALLLISAAKTGATTVRFHPSFDGLHVQTLNANEWSYLPDTDPIPSRLIVAILAHLHAVSNAGEALDVRELEIDPKMDFYSNEFGEGVILKLHPRSTTGPMGIAKLEVDSKNLKEFLISEFVNIPIKSWGHFFPALVASWRYIQSARPGLLGTINCGYDTEPWFKGEGSELFSKVINDGRVITACEEIMYPLAKSLSKKSLRTGTLDPNDIPNIDQNTIDELALAVLAVVDRERD